MKPEVLQACRNASNAWLNYTEFWDKVRTHTPIRYDRHNVNCRHRVTEYASHWDTRNCQIALEKAIYVMAYEVPDVILNEWLQRLYIVRYFDYRQTEDNRFWSLDTTWSRPRMKSRKAMPGYVYLIKMSTGVYKIGYSIEPEYRLQQIFPATLPLGYEIIHTIQTNQMLSCEQYFHQEFSSSQIDGSEWFYLTEEDVKHFCSFDVFNFGWIFPYTRSVPPECLPAQAKKLPAAAPAST